MAADQLRTASSGEADELKKRCCGSPPLEKETTNELDKTSELLLGCEVSKQLSLSDCQQLQAELQALGDKNRAAKEEAGREKQVLEYKVEELMAELAELKVGNVLLLC